MNLLDVCFIQLSKSFRLRYSIGIPSFEVNKVVLYSAQLTVVAIFHEGKLGYWRTGNENWNLLDKNNFNYDDIISYKDQFHVVDRSVTVSWIDSSLKLIPSRTPPPVQSSGDRQKNLVESGGDLYMVDRYLKGRRRIWKDVEDVRCLVGTRRGRKWNSRAVDFKVYKMDQEFGNWVEVKLVGGRVFFLTTECSFSGSAMDFVGGKWDCIYYTDDDDYVAKVMLSDESIRVFQFEDGSIEQMRLLPCHSDIFHPLTLSLFV
ncbi:Putative F-box protein At1g65770 [Linum perenne]